jgi:hypothetical protein
MSFLGDRVKDIDIPKEDVTEGFTLLTNDKKINLKSNLKDTGNNSYKADKLMNILEEYLKNMNK